jgi:hypothetical protein
MTVTDLPVQETPLAPLNATDAALSPEGLIALAIRSGTSVDALERLMTLRERLHAEQARAAFFTALTAFQARCPIIPKTKKARIQSATGSYEYNFAPLDQLAKTIAPHLEACGLSYTFNTVFQDNAQIVTCYVHHVMGHTEESTFTSPIDPTARMNAMQKSGSSRTYGKRYALEDALGITSGSDDDDARATGLQDPPTAEEKHPRIRPGGPRPDTQSAGKAERPVTEGTGEAGATGGGESGTVGRAGRPDVDGVSPAAIKMLEAAIRHFAKTFGVDPDRQRDEVKQLCLDKWGVEHFTQLNHAQFEELYEGIKQPGGTA